LSLYSGEAFGHLNRLWVEIGWAMKYSYQFTWLGRPIIQLGDDIVTIQEILWRTRPDVVIETGVAHGGSLVLSASVCLAAGRGRVVGVDIEIRPHNRAAIEQHELASMITLIEGSSTDPDIVDQVRSLIQPGETVLVILDSNHTRAHVLAELEAYAALVTEGSYIVSTDGIMRDVAGGPGGDPSWSTDNPMKAAEDFLSVHPEFQLEDPPAKVFDESVDGVPRATHWPAAFLRRTT
jgi:cephalosporin hydroxylase